MSNLRQPPEIARVSDALTDRALNALRASEIRYRRLFEAARDGILLLNAETAQIEDVNPYLIEMLGYSHAEFLGKKLWEVGTFAGVPQIKEMFAVLQEEGYVQYDDLPLKTKEGTRIQVEFVSNIYVDDGVRVVQCNIRNITSREHAEESALREQIFTHAVLDSLPGLFYLIDKKGRFLRWNWNFETVSGYSSEEIVQLAPTDLFSGTDKWIIADKIKQVFAAGDVTVEADFVAKDQTRTPYFFTGALVEIDGKSCLIGMGIDITERRQAETALRASETRIKYMNRIYATLSGINSLIVRVRDRDELFREACRIAVDAGGFRMSMIGILDRGTMSVVPVASAGKDDELLSAIKGVLSSRDSAPNSMVA